MRKTTAKEKVARGLAFLDTRFPGWIEHIDLRTFNMASGCNCVLAQCSPYILGALATDLSSATERRSYLGVEQAFLHKGIHREFADRYEGSTFFIDFGFNVVGDVYVAEQEYKELNAEWQTVILERLAA